MTMVRDGMDMHKYYAVLVDARNKAIDQIAKETLLGAKGQANLPAYQVAQKAKIAAVLATFEAAVHAHVVESSKVEYFDVERIIANEVTRRKIMAPGYKGV